MFTRLDLRAATRYVPAISGQDRYFQMRLFPKMLRPFQQTALDESLLMNVTGFVFKTGIAQIIPAKGSGQFAQHKKYKLSRTLKQPKNFKILKKLYEIYDKDSLIPLLIYQSGSGRIFFLQIKTISSVILQYKVNIKISRKFFLNADFLNRMTFPRCFFNNGARLYMQAAAGLTQCFYD